MGMTNSSRLSGWFNRAAAAAMLSNTRQLTKSCLASIEWGALNRNGDGSLIQIENRPLSQIENRPLSQK